MGRVACSTALLSVLMKNFVTGKMVPVLKDLWSVGLILLSIPVNLRFRIRTFHTFKEHLYCPCSNALKDKELVYNGKAVKCFSAYNSLIDSV